MLSLAVKVACYNEDYEEYTKFLSEMQGKPARAKHVKVWDFVILLEGRSYRMIVGINE